MRFGHRGARSVLVLRRSAPALFPFALWFAATFFYLGQTGRFLDDWGGFRQAAPVENVVPVGLSSPLGPWLAPARLTMFGMSDWAVHLFCALAHAGVCVLLWRLLLLLRVGRFGAAAAAMLFLVYPAYFEAVLWMSSLPTLVAAAIVVGAWILACRYACDQAHPLVGYPLVPAMFFIAGCFSEQAAWGVLAVPCLCLIAGGGTFRSVAPRALLTSAASAVAVGASIVVHLALSLRDASGPLFARPAEMPAVAQRAAAWLTGQFASGALVVRAIEAGMEAAAEHPLRAAMVGAALLIGLACWIRSVRPTRRALGRPGLVGAAGALAALACTAPVVVFAYGLNPRIAYAPALGLAILAAAAAGALARLPMLARPMPRALAAGCAGVVMIFGAVAMMGFQRGYRERFAQDQREVARLRELIPEPAPGTVFVPVAIEEPPAKTPGARRYASYFRSALSEPRSARMAVQAAYGRADLTVAQAGQAALSQVGPESVFVRGVGEVEWPRIVPFTLDSDGEPRLVTRVIAGGVAVRVPQTQAVAQRNEVTLPVRTENQNQQRITQSPGPGRKTNRVVASNQPPKHGDPHPRHSEQPIAAASHAAACYANCDGSTAAPVLNAMDFNCFLSRFAAGDAYANCDGSTAPPVLNVNDFACFLTRFAAGCP